MHKNLKILTVLVLFSVIISKTGAQSVRNFDLSYRPSPQNMKVYFDRADLEERDARWMRTSLTGFDNLSSGERASAEAEMAKRYGIWKMRQIEKDLPSSGIETLLKEIERLNIKYLYDTENGEIIFDSNRDPVFKKLAGLESDKTLWDDEVCSVLNSIFEDWENSVCIVYDELSRLSDDCPEEFNNRLTVSFNEYREKIKKEFEYIFTEKEKYFLTKRSLDSFSLKKESENSSASSAASDALKEIEVSLSEARERLEKDLNSISSLPEERVNAELSEWEESYKNEFEIGIKKWENVEKSFLSERLSWEYDAKESYIKAEERWDEAAGSLAIARDRWLSEMSTIMEEGRAYWRERETDFFTCQENASRQMEEASRNEIERFYREADMLLSLYRENRCLGETAVINISWLKGEIDRITAWKAGKQATADRYESEIEDINKEIDSCKNALENLKDNEDSGDDEHGSGSLNIGRAIAVKLFNNRITELEMQLPDLQSKYERAFVLINTKDDELAGYITEHSYWSTAAGSCREGMERAESEILSLEKRIEDSPYGGDEFEMELELLKEKRDLLCRQLEIAQAVYDYSIDFTSQRERKAESEENYRAALALSDEYEKKYSLIISDLDSLLESGLSTAEENVSEKKKILEEADYLYQAAKAEYENSMEIFRLKDSGLLQCSIENLREDVDFFYESERCEAWNEYFLSMENALREEISETSSELLADLLGLSRFDNIENLETALARRDNLYRIEPDFGDPESIGELKAQLALAGIDTESADFKSFEVFFLDGNTEDALSCWEKLKIQQDCLVLEKETAVALLQGDYTENPLTGGSGANYSGGEMSSGDLMLLDAERRAVALWRPLSSAYIDSEREGLSEALFEIFGVIERDDAGGVSVCFTADLEDEEDLTELFESVFEIGAPDYITEILINIAAAEIKAKNIMASSVASDVSEGSDAVNAAKLSFERSLYISEGYRERANFEKLLLLSLSALSSDGQDFAACGNPEEKREAVLALEKSAASALTKLSDLENRLAGFEVETAGYFENNVADLKISLDEKKAAFDYALSEYEQSLSDLSAVAGAYRIKKTEADTAYIDYREASDALQLAQEIMDYAVSPYRLPLTDPLAVLQEKKDDYERADLIYKAVSGIRDSVEKKEYMECLDPEYLDLLEKKGEALSSLNYLSAGAAQLGRDIMVLEEKSGILCSQITDAVSELFIYDYRFTLPDDEENYQITDFTEYNDIMSLLCASEEYFSRQDAGNIFSKDTWYWMNGLFSGGRASGSALLKKFGIAFYSEYKDKVNVALYSDQNYCTLKKGKYADCDPEEYTDESAEAVLESIKNDRDLFLLYSFFRTMMLSGRVVFDTSFIGKDAGHIAHDYLWDESKKEEKEIKKKHPVSNFFERTTSKMSRMRHNMADINGGEERTIISDAVMAAFENRKNLDKCNNQIELLTGRSAENGSVIPFSSLVISIEKAVGKAPAETGNGFPGDAENIYSSLESECKTTSYAAAERLAFEYEKKIAVLDESILALSLMLEKERNNKKADLCLMEEESSISADDIKKEYIDLYYNPSWSMKSGAAGEYEIIKESAFVDFSGKERVLASGNSSAVNLLTACMLNFIDNNEDAFVTEYQQIQNAEIKWQERMSELHRCGISEWNRSFDTIREQRKKWQEEYSLEALRMEELWNDKYSFLVSGREEWINDFSCSAAKGTGESLARKSGIRADELISAAEFTFVPAVNTNNVDLDGIVEEVTDSVLLSSLAESARYHTQGIGNDKTFIASYLPDVCTFSGSAAALENYQKKITEDIRKRGALLTGMKTAKVITEIEDSIRENIETANIKSTKQLSDTLEGKAYKRKGNIFSRSAIIDISLLGGIENERQEIEGYRYFAAPDFDIGVDLDRDSLAMSGACEIELKIDKAVKNLSRYSELIFGKTDSGEAEKWSGFDEDFLEYTKRLEGKYKTSGRYEEYRNISGLFYMHLGYAPLMSEKNPEKVSKEGYGEYGRIYELYLRNEARLGRGLAAIDQPWYSRKMWDDDKNNDGKSDTLLGAPSARSAANIAMSIASGGAGLFTSLALNLADDAAFAALDAGYGITDWDEGVLSLGRSAAVSLASAGISGIGKPAYTENSFITASAKAGLRNSASNLASAGINSFALNSDGLYFDLKDFEKNSRNSLLGAGAAAGYICSMGSAALDSTLTGFYGASLEKGRALDSTIASSAASMWEYSRTGKVKLNILNSSDFGFGNTGLLELGIGSGGNILNIGMDGQNISVSNTASSVKGLEVWHQNGRIYASGEENIRENAVSMRGLYSNRRDEEAGILFENLLSGKNALVIDDSIKGSAQTVYNANRGGRDIRVKSGAGSLYSSLELAVLLGHEAHRDGIAGSGAEQTEETLNAVLAHTVMAGDIGKEYAGFAESNPHLAVEAKLLELALESGNIDLFKAYASASYNSDSDNYFPDFKDFGLKQNSGIVNSNATLGYDESEVNGARFEVQYQKFLTDNGIPGESYCKDDFISLWKNDDKTQKKYKIDLYKNESISEAGCNLYTLLYIQQTLTGNKIDGRDANEILKKEKQFTEGNLLYTDSSKALNILTEGKYSFSFATLSTEDYSDNTIIRILEAGKYSGSPESVRVSTGTHFMVLKDFNTITDKEGSKVISEIEVLNPLKGGRTTYRPDEIKRYDFFRAKISRSRADDLRMVRNSGDIFYGKER